MRRALARRAILALSAAVAVGPAPGPAIGPALGADRDVLVVNHSARTVNELYASPAASDDWGGDRLGDATVPPGGSIHLKLRERDCVFDVQAVYSDASREERRGLDLCRQHTLTFDASRAVAPAGSDGGLHRVAVVNQDNRPIQQVLISAAEAGDWGDDRLGSQSISVGDSAAVSYSGSCVADVRVVFDNRAAEERRGLDLCAQPGLVVAPGWTTAERVGAPAADQTPRERLPITVVNRTGHAASELYVFPEADPGRGPDLLGASLLDEGGQIAVTVMRPHGVCRFAAHVVFPGKVAEQDLAELDLCRDTTLVLPPRS